MSYEDIIKEVSDEVTAQNLKWGEQNHPNGTGLDVRWGRYLLWDSSAEVLRDQYRELCDYNHKTGRGTWLDILLEEMAEAFAEEGPQKLRKELIQVAAVVVNWIDCIDRKETSG